MLFDLEVCMVMWRLRLANRSQSPKGQSNVVITIMVDNSVV